MTADDRAAFLAHRRGKVGASNVAGILGRSPWSSPWAEWARLVGLTGEDDGAETEAMEFGKRAEPMIGPWFADLTGLTVVGEQTWCTHPEHPWRICTVDGFVTEGSADMTDALGLIEMKCTSASAQEWERDGIPDHYQLQGLWQCHVTGLDRVWFAVVHLAFGRPQFRIYEYAPTPADIAETVDAVQRFWTDHAITGIPPAIDDHPATADAITAAYPGDDALPPVDADDDLARLVVEYDAAKRHADAEGKRADALAVAIKAALGDATELHHDGELIASWRPQTTTRIDSKAVRAAHGDAFDAVARTRVLRRHLPSTDHHKQRSTA